MFFLIVKKDIPLFYETVLTHQAIIKKLFTRPLFKKA